MIRTTGSAEDRTVREPMLVPAVARAASILEILKDQPEGCGISEIARILNASKGTVHSILMTLERFSLVQRNDDTKRYRLGFGLIELGQLVLRRIDEMQVIHPHIVALMAMVRNTVAVTVVDGDYTLVIDRVMPDTRLQVNAAIGRHEPITAGSMGKLLMAYMSDDTVDKIIGRGLTAFTKKSIVDKEQFTGALRQIRDTGWAVDDEELFEGVRGVSAPIRNYKGTVIAAVSVAGYARTMSGKQMTEVIDETVRAAAEISAALGAPADVSGRD